MAQHVLIGDLVPALMLLAVRGPLLFFLLPAAVLAPLARSPLRRGLSALLRPKVAFAIWAANLAIWHIPCAVRHGAQARLGPLPRAHVLGRRGLPRLDAAARPGSHRRSGRRRVALAASMFAAGQVLTDVLVFTFHPLYPAYHGAYGISAVTDQQLAGVVMMVEQLLTLGTLVVVLLRPRLRRARLADRRERDELHASSGFPRARRRGRGGLRLCRARRPADAAGAPLVRGRAAADRGSLNSPLETIAAKRLLLIHLLQNALIADIAPLLLLLGLTPRDARLAERTRRAAHPRAVRAARVAARLVRHAHRGLLRLGAPHRLGAQLEHAILIAGGLLFWWPLVSGRLAPPPALAYLGAGFVASSFLGLALIFSSRPFYSFYEHAPRLWGLSPMRDQNLGGILMNGEQTLVFLLAIGYYVWRLLDEEHVSGAEIARGELKPDVAVGHEVRGRRHVQDARPQRPPGRASR